MKGNDRKTKKINASMRLKGECHAVRQLNISVGFHKKI